MVERTRRPHSYRQERFQAIAPAQNLHWSGESCVFISETTVTLLFIHVPVFPQIALGTTNQEEDSSPGFITFR